MRVLFVDDEMLMLRGTERLLGKRFEVRTANSGVEALALLAAEPFDVVVSDLKMPSMDGAAFLAEAKRVAPGVARIMLTASFVDEASLAGLVFCVVPKPCSRDDLAAAIEQAVASRAQGYPES